MVWLNNMYRFFREHSSTRMLESWFYLMISMFLFFYFEKQPSRGVLSKKCSENMPQIYRGTPMQKCNFKLY